MSINTTLEHKFMKAMTFVHECGHAIIATHYKVPILKIDMEIDNNKYPGVHIDPVAFSSLPTQSKLDFYMAGFAATKIYTNLVSLSKDHFARDIAMKIFNDHIDSHIQSDKESALELLKFPFLKDFRINKSKIRAVELLSKYHQCMDPLLKSLIDGNGILDGQNAKLIITNQN